MDPTKLELALPDAADRACLACGDPIRAVTRYASGALKAVHLFRLPEESDAVAPAPPAEVGCVFPDGSAERWLLALWRTQDACAAQPLDRRGRRQSLDTPVRPLHRVTIRAADLPRMLGRKGGRRGGWGVARPGTCLVGHRHPSQLEARACEGLHAEAAATPGAYVIRHARFPLLRLRPQTDGRALTFTPDFVCVAADGSWRAVEAKPATRRSRDWARGAAAWEAEYGRRIEYLDAEKVRTRWGR